MIKNDYVVADYLSKLVNLSDNRSKNKYILGKLKEIFQDEKKRFLFIVCVCTMVFLGFKFIGPGGTITHWIKAKNEIRSQERQMEEYRRGIEAMDKDINELKTNKDSLEKFAREQFKFAAPDEDVYLIED